LSVPVIGERTRNQGKKRVDRPTEIRLGEARDTAAICEKTQSFVLGVSHQVFWAVHCRVAVLKLHRVDIRPKRAICLMLPLIGARGHEFPEEQNAIVTK
jgi:hypothetical protein